MAKNNRNNRTCAHCIHELACQSWNIGHIHEMDATNCAVYETVKDSTAYFIGFLDGKKKTVGRDDDGTNQLVRQ